MIKLLDKYMEYIVVAKNKRQDVIELKRIINRFKEKKLNFDRLMGVIKRDSTDIEFLKSVLSCYEINKSEVSKLFAEVIFKNPRQFAIRTNDYISMDCESGEDDEKMRWTEIYEAEYEIYADKKFDNTRIYQKEEIMEMAERNEIILLEKHRGGSEVVTKRQKQEFYDNRKYYAKPMNFLYEMINDCYLDAKGNSQENIQKLECCYPDILKVIRDSISTKQIEKEYAKFLKICEEEKNHIAPLWNSIIKTEEKNTRIATRNSMREK